jgi:hypothetical protein
MRAIYGSGGGIDEATRHAFGFDRFGDQRLRVGLGNVLPVIRPSHSFVTRGLRNVGSGQGIERGGVNGQTVKYRTVRYLEGANHAHVSLRGILSPSKLILEPWQPVAMRHLFFCFDQFPSNLDNAGPCYANQIADALRALGQ